MEANLFKILRWNAMTTSYDRERVKWRNTERARCLIAMQLVLIITLVRAVFSHVYRVIKLDRALPHLLLPFTFSRMFGKIATPFLEFIFNSRMYIVTYTYVAIHKQKKTKKQIDILMKYILLFRSIFF